MNKLNNNEALQMNTVMPTIKKSLLALAVAGSMAMSGGAYADGIITVAATGSSTGTPVVVTLGATGNDTITLTDGTFSSNVISGTSGTTLVLGITDVATAGVPIGAIFLGDASSAEVLTLTSIDAGEDVDLTIGAVTGIGTLKILGENSGGNHALNVLMSADIGTVGASLAGIEITGGDHEDEDASLMVLQGEPVFSNVLLTDGAASATLILGDANAGTTAITGNITSGLDSTGTISVVKSATITGNIGTGIVAGTTALKAVSVADGETIAVTGTVNVDTLTFTGASTATFNNDTTINSIVLGTLDSTDDAIAIDFDTVNQAFTAAVNFTSNDTSDANVINIFHGADLATGSANTLTYSNAIATVDGIDTINVGKSTQGGNAVFSSNVISTITTLNIVGGTVASESSSAEFQGDLTASAIALTTAASGTASLVMNSTNGVATVTSSIQGAGTLSIIDDDATVAADLVTIAGLVGTTTGLDTLTVGNATQAGNAVFTSATAAIATAITIAGGDHANEASTVEFQEAVTATTIVLDKNTADATMIINATNDAQTVAGSINGETDGDGILSIIDDDIDEAAHAISFSGVIGTTKRLGAINVGNSEQAGSAIFTAAATTVNADAVVVTGGNHEDEDSTIQFNDGAEITNGITLDDNLGDAIMIVDADEGTQSITSIINGESDNEGTLTITDSDTEAPNLVSFVAASVIGGSSRLKTINIGSASLAGAADFDGNVTVSTLNIYGGNAADENSALTNASSSIIDVKTLNLTGGTTIGGNALATVTGTLRVGTGGIAITGGAGVTSAIGGDATLTLDSDTTTLAGNTTIDGGDAGSSTGNGGAALFDSDEVVTSTGSFTLTGGIGASAAGDGDGGAASIDAEKAFTATTVTLEGGAGGLEATDAANGGAAIAHFNTTLNVTGLVLNGGLGGSVAANIGGNATATVVTTSTIGTGGITLLGGTGGAYAEADGGATSLTLTGDSLITGAVSITGGTGATAAADGGASDALFTGIVTATNQTLTINGGAGSSTLAGIGGAASATFAADATLNSIVLNDGLAGTGTGGIATLNSIAAANNTINGAITASLDGEGVIAVANSGADVTTTFANNIGTSDVRIGTLSVTSDTSKINTADFDGDVYVDAITVKGVATAATAFFGKNVGFTTLTLDKASVEATATFNGSGIQTVSGLIDGQADGDGAIIADNTGTVTFSNAIGSVLRVGSITSTSQSKSVFDSTVNASTMSLSGATTFNDQVTLSSTLAIANGSAITLGPNFKSGGEVAITSATSTGAFDDKTITVNLSHQFNTGTITFLDNNAALDAADLAAFTMADTALVDYSIARGQTDALNDSLIITADARTAAGVATHLGMSASQADALTQVATAVTTGDATASSALNSILKSGGTTAVNAIEQMNPDVGAMNGAALAAVSAVNNVISGRQASTRIAFNSLGKQSGVSTGDAANDVAVWAQIFGSTATQDQVGTIDGYDADSTGLALGWEIEKSDDLMGFSLSYSDADVDGKTASASHTDTTAVQATVYGNTNSTDWMAAYASGNNKTKRTLDFGGLSARTASGTYHSDVVMAKVGHSFDTTGSFTPKADLSWTHISNDDYIETGADNLGLKVASSTNDIVTARAGVEFTQNIMSNDSGKTIPHISFMAGYDFVNDAAETTSTFIGGGSSFTTKGAAPEKVSFDIAGGVDHVSDDSTVSLNFNANLRDGYDSVTGDLTFKSKF